jgi:glutathione S-transferase
LAGIFVGHRDFLVDGGKAFALGLMDEIATAQLSTALLGKKRIFEHGPLGETHHHIPADIPMLTFFDYPASENAWKIRQLLRHLELPHRTVNISIFEGEGRTVEYLRISPTGTVPAIQLEDGHALAESNAILFFLATGTRYLPDDAFGRAKVVQRLSFEQERVESVIGSLRYWTLTGKLDRRAPALVEMKRNNGQRSLQILDRELAGRPFLTDHGYSIADISVFAYTSHAEEAGFSLEPYPHVRAWLARVASQPGFLATMHPYSDDPHSALELP